MNKIVVSVILFFLVMRADSQSSHQPNKNSNCESVEWNGQLDLFIKHRAESKFDSALVAAKSMQKIASQFEEDCILIPISKMHISSVFWDLNEPDSNVFYIEESSNLFVKQGYGESKEHGECLHYRALSYHKLGRFPEADSCYRAALLMREKVLGELDDACFRTSNYLAILQMLLGNYPEMLHIRMRRLEQFERRYGAEHATYAEELVEIYKCHSYLGNYQEIEPTLTKAIDIFKKAVGEKDTRYAIALNLLAQYYSSVGSYDVASRLYEKWNELRMNYSSKDKDFGTGLGNYAFHSMSLGNYELAIALAEQASAQIMRATGGKDATYGQVQHLLAQVNLQLGHYEKAEGDALSALENLEVFYSKNHPIYGGTLITLATIYSDMGVFSKAEATILEAVNIIGGTLGLKHDYYAASLGSKANIYLRAGNFSMAKSTFEESLAIYTEVLGPDHVNCALMMSAIADVYVKLGENDSAEQFYTQAMSNILKSKGESNLDYASNLDHLGLLYKSQGKLILAEEAFRKSTEIVQTKFGSAHPLCNTYKGHLAAVLTEEKKYSEATVLYKGLLEEKSRYVMENFAWLSDYEREQFWNEQIPIYQDVAVFASESYQSLPEAAALNYDAELSSKCQLLESRLDKEIVDSSNVKLHSELQKTRRHIIKLQSDGSDDVAMIDVLQFHADSLDKILTKSQEAFGRQKRNLGIGWEEVQKNILDDEAAIEFILYDDKKTNSRRYQALLLRSGNLFPKLVPLCSESELHTAISRGNAGAYYSLIWQAIDSHLTGVKSVYYSPVGELNNVSFCSFYTSGSNEATAMVDERENRGIQATEIENIVPTDAIYLSDRYELHQVISTRYLAINMKAGNSEKIKHDIALIGGVNYNYLPGTKTVFSGESKQKGDAVELRNGMNYLEGTKREVDAIQNTLKKGGWKTEYFTGDEATEDGVAVSLGNTTMSVVHIATHGFAFPESTEVGSIDANDFKSNFRRNKNPMVRCGLLLAGGNWAWIGSDTLSKLGATENGILTALEVSQMNLRNTKLVVLSACETGLGKIEGSEGTFGLLRAFKLAGVEQIIVSLWSVPDKETTELMTIFYEDLAKTENAVTSFATAQKAMRVKYPTRPLLWAGFVLVR